MADYGSLAPDNPDRLFPVSGHLKPLDTAKHSSSLTAAADLIAERRGQYGPDDPSVRALELGLARRRVELTSGCSPTSSPGSTAARLPASSANS